MVERFRKTKLIGKGGFGKVYEAIDLHNRETVALKELFGNFTTFHECRNLPEVKAL
jgi:serine/threonine protein kinase